MSLIWMCLHFLSILFTCRSLFRLYRPGRTPSAATSSIKSGPKLCTANSALGKLCFLARGLPFDADEVSGRIWLARLTGRQAIDLGLPRSALRNSRCQLYP